MSLRENPLTDIMRLKYLLTVLPLVMFSACFGSSIGGSAKHDVQLLNVNTAILDVFPSAIDWNPESGRGKTHTSFAYMPTDSSWAQGIDEESVFHMEMKHTQDRHNSFALRIGKGGQIYSLRGVFGESVPPSSQFSPWNDEVWQFVAACERYNKIQSLQQAGPVPKATLARFKELLPMGHYFVHNSGSYIFEGSKIKNLYCPLLASAMSADGGSYRMLNWGLTSMSNTLHRSPLLYYFQTRDLGDGVIELTWVVHNFSVRDDIVFSYLNAPWGGTRRTSLPYHYIATPQGHAVPREQVTGKIGMADPTPVDFRATGGWSLACATEESDSPTMAVVFGRDKNLESELEKAATGQAFCQFKPSQYRNYLAAWPNYEKGAIWEDWETRPENSFRNYDVVEAAARLHIKPGTTIFWRSFLVINRRDRAIKLANTLVDEVDYGLVTFDPAHTPKLPVSIEAGRVVDSGQTSFELYAHPVSGTMPVFLIEHSETGREVLTTDPYIFVDQEQVDLEVPVNHPHYDYYQGAVRYRLMNHNSTWKRLLGYAYVEKPDQGEYTKLSEILEPSQFPAPTKFHLDLFVEQLDNR